MALGRPELHVRALALAAAAASVSLFIFFTNPTADNTTADDESNRQPKELPGIVDTPSGPSDNTTADDDSNSQPKESPGLVDTPSGPSDQLDCLNCGGPSPKSGEWYRVADAAELRAEAVAGRGIHSREKTGHHPALAIFLSLKDNSVYAIEDACPHAGHAMSKGDLLVGDIEDLAPGCGLGPIVACPAHAFTYDASSGWCLSNPGSGGRTSRWEAKIEGESVLVGPIVPSSGEPPVLTKEQCDNIQLRMVGQALDRKYGNC